MAYVVKRSFYEGNTLHVEGAEFKHDDQAYVTKCLDDGNVAEADAGSGETSAVPLVETPSVDSVSPAQSQPQPVAQPAPQPTRVDPVAQQIATDPQILG